MRAAAFFTGELVSIDNEIVITANLSSYINFDHFIVRDSLLKRMIVLSQSTITMTNSEIYNIKEYTDPWREVSLILSVENSK